MDDLGVLDNLVANTTFLMAQQANRSVMRKHRLSLSLPKPTKLTSGEATGKEFDWLCEQQPIGKRLFQQFLLISDPQYIAAARFLEELREWDYAEGVRRNVLQKKIISMFCQTGSRSFLSFLTGAEAETLKSLTEENFEEKKSTIQKATYDFLKGRPFLEYLDSHFYYKFLQWKELEKQTITDKYFYEFRILGKGGFGEVSVLFQMFE